MIPRSAALRVLKAAAAAGDHLRRPVRGVVVLIYHRVGARSRCEIDLPAEVFERQMAWLAESGRAVGLDAALDWLAQPAADDDPAGQEPSRPVVVTFDDGTADLAEVALPILARLRIPVTMYLATRYIDDQLPWPADGRPLSWAGARELVDSGLVTIGSHTHSHRLLDRLGPEEAAEELDRSQQLLQDRLQVPVEHLAYPKAVAPSPAVDQLVRQRFRSAAVGGSRPNRYGRTDPYRLARTAVQVSDGMGYFRRKAEGGMALEDAARQRLNRRRYREVTV